MTMPFRLARAMGAVATGANVGARDGVRTPPRPCAMGSLVPIARAPGLLPVGRAGSPREARLRSPEPTCRAEDRARRAPALRECARAGSRPRGRRRRPSPASAAARRANRAAGERRAADTSSPLARDLPDAMRRRPAPAARLLPRPRARRVAPPPNARIRGSRRDRTRRETARGTTWRRARDRPAGSPRRSPHVAGDALGVEAQHGCASFDAVIAERPP